MLTQALNNGHSIRVWIIEDELYFREVLSAKLNEVEGMGCDYAFASVESALPVFAENDLPDVVLVDLQLPGINGIEAIRQLKASYPSLQLIVLTISAERRTVFDAICAGASGYLIKNDSFEKIIDGIRLVCEGGSPLSGAIASMVLAVFQGNQDLTKECNLTPRETEILRMLSQGLANKEIADALSIASHTVDFHLRNTYEKLQVNSQAGAVGKAIRKGLI